MNPRTPKAPPLRPTDGRLLSGLASLLARLAFAGGTRAFGRCRLLRLVRLTGAFAKRRNVDVQRRIRVEIDVGCLVSEIAPLTILARVKERRRRQFGSVFLGSPRRFVGGGRRLKPG